MNLRKYAKGKDCQIRLPGCNHNNDTVVLCHYRGPSTGTGLKEPDLLGAWGCQNCHDIVDGREKLPHGYELRDVEIAFFEGIMRTQNYLIKHLFIKW